jgi:hypothetical protein
MQEERLPKLIMEWIPGERRKRGRSRKTWMECVRAAMKTRNLEADEWLNRKEWWSEAIIAIILFATTGTFEHVIFYTTFLYFS